MAAKQKAGHGGARKHGRNKTWCERYRIENRRVRNKIKRLRSHLRHHKSDLQAARALKAIV